MSSISRSNIGIYLELLTYKSKQGLIDSYQSTSSPCSFRHEMETEAVHPLTVNSTPRRTQVIISCIAKTTMLNSLFSIAKQCTYQTIQPHTA